MLQIHAHVHPFIFPLQSIAMTYPNLPPSYPSGTVHALSVPIRLFFLVVRSFVLIWFDCFVNINYASFPYLSLEYLFTVQYVPTQTAFLSPYTTFTTYKTSSPF